MSAAQERDALRARMRAARRALCSDAQAACAQRLAEHVIASPVYQRAHTVMLYAAAKGEIPLQPVLEDVLASGRRAALPLCGGPGEMTAREIRSADELRPGAYGVPEPPQDSPIVPPEEIGLVLVPGTAFDAAGGRLGQGGGYYDRYLTKTDAYRMGVCHSFALIGEVPVLAHDVRMDAVATEEGIRICGGRPQHHTGRTTGGIHDEQEC